MVYRIEESETMLTLEELRWVLRLCQQGERVRVAAAWVRQMRAAQEVDRG